MWNPISRLLRGALRFLTTGRLRQVLGDRYDEPAEAAAAALELVDWQAVTDPLVEALARILAPEYQAAADTVHRDHPRRPHEAPQLLQPSDALAWARQHAALRVVEINADTRTAIRDRIETGLREGRSVDAVAADVRQVVGLHSRWAQAVNRRAAALDAAGTAPAVKAKVINEYRNRLLDARARNIAHTELLTASAAGRLAGWSATVDPGERVEKVWVTSPHLQRVCPICLPMNGVAVEGLEGSFVTARGSFLHPPAHPGCLCTAILRRQQS